jgi:ribonucleoside-diphosphate reductase beta chain
MPLDVERIAYKPFEYPWAYEAWKAQHTVHWLADEIPLADDVKDWHKSLTDGERNLVTQIFRFFTQSDVEVNNCYNRVYSRIFKPFEVVMMLTAFSDMETIHVDAYSHLLETIGMPAVEYQKFLEYKEMKDKFDYLRDCLEAEMTPMKVAETLAVFGAFTEGLQLFASFAILLNFPRAKMGADGEEREGKLKGMGQVVTYSARDETIHALSVIRLFHVWVEEQRAHIDVDILAERLYEACRVVVAHEDKFIDLAYEAGPVEGLRPEEVKAYIRYMADIRLSQLGLQPIYGVTKNPLPWMDQILNGIEFAAFFEQRATEYTKSATVGDWADVTFDASDFGHGDEDEFKDAA